MSERVTFMSKGGDPADGILAVPAKPYKAPGILVLQEYWGVNDHIKSIVTRYASEGFIAVAPDLYHGQIAKDATEAQAMMGKLDWPRAMSEIAGAVEWLRHHPRCNGKVAITGYCMGGALTFAAACNITDLACIIPYYGLPPATPAMCDWSKVTVPVLAHFARKDGWATPEKAKAIQETLTAAGKKMDLHVYDADHAFANDTRPEVHSPEATAQAWSRSIAFLREYTT